LAAPEHRVLPEILALVELQDPLVPLDSKASVVSPASEEPQELVDQLASLETPDSPVRMDLLDSRVRRVLSGRLGLMDCLETPDSPE